MTRDEWKYRYRCLRIEARQKKGGAAYAERVAKYHTVYPVILVMVSFQPDTGKNSVYVSNSTNKMRGPVAAMIESAIKLRFEGGRKGKFKGADGKLRRKVGHTAILEAAREWRIEMLAGGSVDYLP